MDNNNNVKTLKDLAAEITQKCNVCGKTDPESIHRCDGCGLAFYCSTECQTEAWQNHGHNAFCQTAQEYFGVGANGLKRPRPGGGGSTTTTIEIEPRPQPQKSLTLRLRAPRRPKPRDERLRELGIKLKEVNRQAEDDLGRSIELLFNYAETTRASTGVKLSAAKIEALKTQYKQEMLKAKPYHEMTFNHIDVHDPTRTKLASDTRQQAEGLEGLRRLGETRNMERILLQLFGLVEVHDHHHHHDHDHPVFFGTKKKKNGERNGEDEVDERQQKLEAICVKLTLKESAGTSPSRPKTYWQPI
jgi:hypothetical protein